MAEADKTIPVNAPEPYSIDNFVDALNLTAYHPGKCQAVKAWYLNDLRLNLPVEHHRRVIA